MEGPKPSTSVATHQGCSEKGGTGETCSYLHPGLSSCLLISFWSLPLPETSPDQERPASRDRVDRG